MTGVPAILRININKDPEGTPNFMEVSGMYYEETETLVRYVGQGGRKEIYSGVKYLVEVTPQDHLTQPTETLFTDASVAE